MVRKSRNRNYQQIQDYLRFITKNNKRETILHQMKHISDVGELREVQGVVRTLIPTIDSDIEGRVFPADYHDLCTILVPFIRPISLHSELVWLSSYLNKYDKTLKWFVAQKKLFEHNFLIGNFSDCFAILEEVKKQIGVSLWYYESIFVLYEYCDRRKEGVMLMSSCLEKTKGEDVNHLQMLVYRLQQRGTTNISPYKYDEDLDALYKKSKTLLHEDNYRYSLFRLNMYNNMDQEDLSYNIMFESLSALVDRYLMAVNVLRASAVRDRLDKDLLSRARYLYSKIGDKELLPLIEHETRKHSEDYYDGSFIQILDSYYKGEYAQTINLCRQYVATNSTRFDVTVLYCRALVYEGRIYENICDKKNAPINLISSKVYDVLVDGNNSETTYSLYQINKNLYGFHIAAAMHVFVHKELNEHADEKVRTFWNTCFDPEYALSAYTDTEEAMAYLRSYQSHESSTACKIAIAKLKNEPIEEGGVAYNVMIPHNASIDMGKEKYDDAYELWKKFYDASPQWLPNRQKAVRNMVACQHASGKTGKALSLYVDYLLSDKASILKVDTDAIIKQMQDNLYEGIRRNIDLAIFMGLNCKDEVDKSFILLEFCETNGVELPSELIGKLDEPIDRQEVFFSVMNNDETLRHYFNIPSLKERLNERLKIINYLLSLDTANREMYKRMQKEVEDALLVYRVSKNLNEGKIYANDQAILKYKLQEIDGLYLRYMRFFDMILNDKSRILVINFSDSTVLMTDTGYEGGKIKSQTSVSENGIYEVFYSLYDYILDKFLYSEFGLVAYLSTRVRHGELESKLRPELDQRHLILSMKDNVYQDTNYWQKTYNLTTRENRAVNTALAKFSENFDKLVVDLIKERLQIYDKEKKPNGLFNYETDETELAVKAMEIGLLTKETGKDDFCKEVLKWLWQKTENSLMNIRQYVAGEFTENINELFDTLKEEMGEDALPIGHAHAFIQAAIADASSVIASRLKSIECWFNITGLKLEDVDYKQLTHQVFNNIVVAYPQVQVSGKPKMEGESFKIKASFVLHYADLLRNLITNIFRHGLSDESGEKPIVLNFQVAENVLKIHMENKVNVWEEDALNKKFQEKLSSGASYYNSEGGSGIAKAHKILLWDLQCQQNELSIIAHDGRCTTDVTVNIGTIKTNE